MNSAEEKRCSRRARNHVFRKRMSWKQIYLFEEGADTKVKYGEQEVTLNRLKLAKRDGVGTKHEECDKTVKFD